MEQDLIQQLEACETESRSLIRQGNIRGLEPVMRRWEDLLSRCQSQGLDTADSHYFAMVFISSTWRYTRMWDRADRWRKVSWTEKRKRHGAGNCS